MVTGSGKKRGRPHKDDRANRRTRAEAVEERSHIVRRSNPATGVRGGKGRPTAYVSFDPETFAQVRARALGEGTSFAAAVRALVDEGLGSVGMDVTEKERREFSRPTGGRPAVGATRRNDVMPFTSTAFDEIPFARVRERALAEGTSFAEQVRQLVEWALDDVAPS